MQSNTNLVKKVNIPTASENLKSLKKSRRKFGGKKRIINLFIYIVLILISYQFLYPLLRMFVTAMMSEKDIITPSVNWIPSGLSFENLKVASGVLGMPKTLFNSLWFSGGLAVCQTIVSAMTGFSFARYDFKFKNFWFVMVLLTFIVPMPVLMIPRSMMFSQFQTLTGINMIGTPIPLCSKAVHKGYRKRWYNRRVTMILKKARVFSAFLMTAGLFGCSSHIDTENIGEVEAVTEKTTITTKAAYEIPEWKTSVRADGFNYDIDNLDYKLVWSDEFDYIGSPDPEKWGYDVGGSGWGNNELQYYTSGENVYVDGEKMILELRSEERDSKEYTSTRIITKNKGDWKYGKFDIMAKLPSGKGTWPAIWMLPTDWEYGIWPDAGEIDIMEHVGYDENRIHFTVHTLAYNHIKGTQKGSSVQLDDVCGEFHKYSLEWLPDMMIWYIDDEEVHRYEPNKLVTAATYREWPFDTRFHLLINIAFGGDWGGAQGIDPNIMPVTMEVDYVRVYQSEKIR